MEGGSRALPTHRTTQTEYTHTDIHAPSGIRTNVPSVQGNEDGSYLRPRGHRVRSTFPLPDKNGYNIIIRLIEFFSPSAMAVVPRVCIIKLGNNISTSRNVMVIQTWFCVRSTCSEIPSMPNTGLMVISPRLRVTDVSDVSLGCREWVYYHFTANRSSFVKTQNFMEATEEKNCIALGGGGEPSYTVANTSGRQAYIPKRKWQADKEGRKPGGESALNFNVSGDINIPHAWPAQSLTSPKERATSFFGAVSISCYKCLLSS
jgi:hypothetical protein